MNSPSEGRHRAAPGPARARRTARSLGAGLLAAALVVLLTPFGVGIAAASQQGEDHKVTLCHRTNSENNPYVTITVDKAAVFKRGHDTHDEGGVYQPGDKAAGIRWGDIIPAFDYYATPKDTETTRYPGLNNTAEGMAILANGCQVPDESEDAEPAGTLVGECVPNGSYVVSGTLEDDGAADAQFRLLLSTGDTIALDGTTFEESITAAAGTTVVLQGRVGSGDWVTLDGPVTVEECVEVGGNTGTIKIRKVIEGDPIGTETDFTVRVDCTGTAFDQDVLLTEGNGWVNTTTAIPTGTVCDLREIRVPSGWNPEGITPDTVTVGVGTSTQADAVVENERRTGRVSITKVIEGDPSGVSTDFTVVLDCPGTTYDRTAVLTQANNWTVTYRGIPSGLMCTVTEPTVPAGWELVSVSPAGEFRIDSFDTVPVVVTNRRVVTTTPVVPVRGLGVVKAVSPTGAANFGDTLTYSLTVTTTGNAEQTNVTVTDAIPTGTTYVAGSAACDPGACTTSVTGGTVTWSLGTMAAGTSRTVTFAVTINTPAAGPDGSLPAVEIVNVGAVRSTEVGTTPSNEVRTPVAAVLGTKTGSGGGDSGGGDSDNGVGAGGGGTQPDTVVGGVKSGGGVLAATGAGLSIPAALGLSALLLIAGTVLIRLGVARD